MDYSPLIEQITAVYEEADKPEAGQDVNEAKRDFSEAFDNYCAAITYETFLWAYALGYSHGHCAGLEGGNAHD